MQQPELANRGPATLVRYTVRSSAPAVPNHPASELEKQSSDTLGYVAASTPAEVVLELQGAPQFSLAQLQLLSHESKIASRIDVSVAESLNGPFRLVGYMDLDTNEKSGFMARELQCVKLDCPAARLVKLVLHEAHHNEMNPKAHVGVIGLNLLGWPNSSRSEKEEEEEDAPVLSAKISAPERRGGGGQGAASSPSSDPSPSAALVALNKKAEELRQAKESAVSREQYDEAIRLKTQEAEVRQRIESAAEVERAKQAAVAREDYDEAKRLKDKLDEILGLSRPASRQSPERPLRSTVDQTAMSPEPRRPNNSSTLVTPRSPPVPAIRSSQKPGASSPLPVPEGPPAGFWTGIPDSEVLPVAETLDAHLSNSDELRMMRGAFDEYTLRCIYSADIRLRVAILDRIESFIRLGKLPIDQTLSAAIHVTALGLSETAPHAFLSAIRLLETILDRASSDKLRLLPELREGVVQHLAEGLNNSSVHVQQAASDNIARLATELFGFDAVMKHIVSKQQRRSTLWKPLVAKMTVISRLANADALFEESETPDMWILGTLDWIKSSSSFAHANEQVRDAALNLTVVLYGKAQMDLRLAVEDFLKNNLRPATLEKYLSALRGGHRASVGRESRSSSRVEEQGNGVNEVNGTCQLCGETGLNSENELDLHWWRDCAMLAHCPHCRQVIEIARLNEHLLEECRFRENHKACPRCGEAIAAQLLDKHLRKNSCLPAKDPSEANRCPLCHQDIAPYESGWRMHLLIDTCPYNVRTMDFDDVDEDEYEDEEPFQLE